MRDGDLNPRPTDYESVATETIRLLKTNTNLSFYFKLSQIVTKNALNRLRLHTIA